MENIIYRIHASPDAKIEFYVCGTNELEPFRDTKELGIVALEGVTQIDGGLDVNGIDSLIQYLTDVREYIAEYNEGSKPREGKKIMVPPNVETKITS